MTSDSAEKSRCVSPSWYYSKEKTLSSLNPYVQRSVGGKAPVPSSARGSPASKGDRNVNATLLLVDDDDALRGAIRRYAVRQGMTVLDAATCAEAFEILDRERERIDLLLTDVRLPDGLGFEIVDKAGSKQPAPGVVVMTGNGCLENAISALQHGAADFLLKPFSFDALDAALERARGGARITPVPGPRKTEPQSAKEAWRNRYAPGMLGSHEQLTRVFAMIERVADTDCSILVTGESGTGKELVARAIHAAGDRRNKPFVTVNCAAIPDNLLESELFGHAKGSFTGATSARVGRFAAADSGTIFLDEIGELPLALQAKLLRVLQEKEITPVGELHAQKVDVRIIAATNRDLEEMVEAGTFREDLLYRLNVIPIELPPLRERSSDVPELVEHFIKRANERRDRHITGIEQRAMEALTAYDWPGNIRQLENTIERIVILRSEGEITIDDLPPKLRVSRRTPEVLTLGEPMLPDEGIDLRDAVDRFENALILQALERTGWNKNRAAAILQMNRTTLVEKLKKKGLDERAA
ncbi:MAG: sigma-54-dependent Fis family transcriptional regulator [Deltaproteobacteria bacterium]|nr:sigma-54-dependent Fis family transcriptional regulator [Deltaproteobacteria bacterium]